MADRRTVTLIAPWTAIPADRTGHWPARGNYRTGNDPWIDGVGPTQCELEYHVGLGDDRIGRVVVAMAYIVAMFIAHSALYRAAGPYMSTPFALSLMVLYFALTALYPRPPRYQVFRQPWLFLFTISAWVLIFFKLLIVKYVAEYVILAAFLLIVGICLTLKLADMIGLNFIHRITSYHRLPASTRDEYRRAYLKRFENLRCFRLRQAQVIPTYWVGFVLPAIALGIASCLTYVLHRSAPGRPFLWMHLALMFTLVQWSLAVVVLFMQGPEAWEINPFRTVWYAFVVWINYGTQPLQRPGVYQSPYGYSRNRLLLLTLFVLTGGLLPLVRYFPVVMACVPGMPWIDTASRSALRSHSAALEAAGVGVHPIPATTEHLTWTEHMYRERLREHNHYWAMDYDLQKRRLATRIPHITERRAGRAFLLAAPENWIFVAITGVLNGDHRFAWALTVGFLLSVFIPLLLMGALIFGVLASLLPLAYVRIAGEFQPDHADAYYLYRRLAESSYEVDGIRERDHLLVGFDQATGSPVLLPLALLERHAQITGGTQSGKTSRAILPLVEQLIIRMGTQP